MIDRREHDAWRDTSAEARATSIFPIGSGGSAVVEGAQRDLLVVVVYSRITR
jgi:hypothetical protein